MTSGFIRVVPVLIALPLVAVQAQVASLSGTWHLNVDKSRWGKVQKPVTAVVTITHEEPRLQYTGSIVYASGEDTRPFSFDGAIDGKQYPVTRSVGPGKVALRRIDNATVFSLFRSDDGLFLEEATTSVSRDGKTIRRALRREGPDGSLRWTEIWQRM